jgi:hypothetical protein
VYVTVDSTKEILDRLDAVTAVDVAGIIVSHPQLWLTEAEKERILTWWASHARKDRIDGIRKGIKDGTYL